MFVEAQHLRVEAGGHALLAETLVLRLAVEAAAESGEGLDAAAMGEVIDRLVMRPVRLG